MSTTDVELGAYYQGLRRQPRLDVHRHLERWRQSVRPGLVVLELGIRQGVSTAAFLVGGAHVVGVDSLKSGHSPNPNVAEHPRFSLIVGDDTDPQVFERAAELGPYDALHIDTSHTEEHTRQELALYTKLVRPGGRVWGHDAELPGVSLPFIEWALHEEHVMTIFPGSHGLVEVRT